MIELEIMVDNKYRNKFNEIANESKIEIIKEKKFDSGPYTWVTIRAASVGDIFWLGRNYESIQHQ